MLLKKFKVDDVVDAIPVHGACGAWGVLAVGLFGNEREGVGGNGLFYGGDQLGVQVMGVLLITLWTGTLSILILLPLRLAGMLRFSDAFQEAGADEMEHYPMGAYADTSAVKRRPSNFSGDSSEWISACDAAKAAEAGVAKDALTTNSKPSASADAPKQEDVCLTTNNKPSASADAPKGTV